MCNLTADCRVNKVRTVYCCAWSDNIARRAANEIASAPTHILENVVRDHLQMTGKILWSDACVPQNRNSFMSLALM